MSTTPFPHPASRSVSIAAIVVIITVALAFWLAGLWFFTRHNDFPIYYHPDESSKGQQIVSGELNFHHPLLLLDTAHLLLNVTGITGTSVTVEHAVQSGRLASALFASTAVVLLGLLGYRLGGWLAGLAAALLVAAHPLLYELAHYCKEDPALLLGLSLGMLLLEVFLARSTTGNAAWLGAAAGLAVSGKYLGIVLLPVVLAVVIWRGWRKKNRLPFLLGACLGSWLAIVLVINLPYLLHPSALKSGLGYELNAAQLGGTKGLSRDVPHGKYLGIFLDNLGWPLWLGLALFAWRSLWQTQGRRVLGLILLLFPLAYTLLLSFSPKTASRYFLAAGPFMILAGCIGLAGLGDFLPNVPRLPRWVRLTVSLAAVGLAAWVQMGLFAPSWQGFQTDSRREMAAWIDAHLPPDASLLAESRIHLSKAPTWSQPRRPDLRITEEQFAPDLGTLDELYAQGIRYLAVIRTSYGGFMDEKRKPVKSLEEQHRKRSTFYRELFEKGTLEYKTGGAGVGIINPEIRLYALPGPSK